MTKQEYLNDGFQLFSKREYEKAKENFEKALELDDKFEAAYSALSETLNRQGLVDEAVEIVNIRPTSLAELRSFTFGWKKLILAETLEKMLKIIKEHS